MANYRMVDHRKHRTMFSWNMNIFYPNRPAVLQYSTPFQTNNSWDGTTTQLETDSKRELEQYLLLVKLGDAYISHISINRTRFLVFQELNGPSGERHTFRTRNSFTYQVLCWDTRPHRTNVYVPNVVTRSIGHRRSALPNGEQTLNIHGG